MSALQKLALVTPPRVDDQISIDFMVSDLAKSGLVPEDLDAYPISSQKYDFVGSYVIPYSSPTMWRSRHDRAVNKYLQPKGMREVWYSPHQDIKKFKDGTVLFVVEGEKKAARLYKQWPNLNVLGIGGAWNGLENADDGTKRLLPDIQRCLSPGMRVCIIYDGDIETKPNIQQAATAMRHALSAHSCELEVFRPPFAKGLDDWLQEEPDPSLQHLVPISFESLAESRKQLYKLLSCSMNDDKLVLNELNASKILSYYFGRDVFQDKRLGIIKNGEVSDPTQLEHECIKYLQGDVNYHFKVYTINKGIDMALTQKRDLVQEMVRALPWDGVERLDTWGSEHFESDFPAFANEWGRLLITGLGLRILKPGTKVDYACILIGAQGIGKSTFFEDLSTFDGHQFYYAVTDLSGNAQDSNRTQGQLFSKALIVDLAEGVIFETKKTSMDRAKQMLTQTHDEYRVAYAKVPTVEERGFIFVGTTNRIDQLGDATGSRRFLNLETSKITRLPYHTKLQLLAEVAAKELEIRQSPWYDMRLTIEQAPSAMREAHQHISSVQELVNAKYHRADLRADLLVSLFESGELARLKDQPDVMYVTAGYLASRLGEDSTMSKALCARLLSSLSTSPTFPLKLTNARKRLPQLIMTEGMSFGYTAGISNAQLMVNGLTVERR